MIKPNYKEPTSRRKPVLEQYPEEKHSELLPGNRLWMVVKFGAIYREHRQLKRETWRVRESLGTVSFKEGLSVFLSIF